MKKQLIAVCILTASLVATACSGGGGNPLDPPASGSIYVGVKGSVNCSEHGEAGCASEKDGKPVGSKIGEACATSILGLIATGDMSLKAGAAAGNITKVMSIDYSNTTILGSVLVSKCILVNGE